MLFISYLLISSLKNFSTLKTCNAITECHSPQARNMCSCLSYVGLNVISYPLESTLQSKIVMGILNVTDRNGLSCCGHLQ